MKKQVLMVAALLSAAVATSKLNAYCLELVGNEEVKVIVLKSKTAWEDLKKTKSFFDWAKTQAKQVAGQALGGAPGAAKKGMQVAEKAEEGLYKELDKMVKGKSLKAQSTADVAKQLSSPLGTLVGNIQLAIVRIGDANYLTPQKRVACYDWIRLLTTLNHPFYNTIAKKQLGAKDAGILRDVANFEEDYKTTLGEK